jgi:hypothetical protein
MSWLCIACITVLWLSSLPSVLRHSRLELTCSWQCNGSLLDCVVYHDMTGASSYAGSDAGSQGGSSYAGESIGGGGGGGGGGGAALRYPSDTQEHTQEQEQGSLRAPSDAGSDVGFEIGGAGARREREGWGASSNASVVSEGGSSSYAGDLGTNGSIGLGADWETLE